MNEVFVGIEGEWVSERKKMIYALDNKFIYFNAYSFLCFSLLIYYFILLPFRKKNYDFLWVINKL